MAEFVKIGSLSLIDAVKQQLMAKILSGELKPGDRLPAERDMADKLGVSRSSLHQAVLSLESEGFVSVVARRGTIVNDFRKNPTPQSLAALMSYGSIELDHSLFSDMMDTRIWLESECARRACTHIYASTLEEMKAMVDAMEKGEGDLSELIYRFHYKLTQASGNSLYSMIFRGFEQVIRSLIEKHYSMKPGDIQESIRLRRSLLAAIEANQPQAAADYVCKIICQGVDVLEERYH